MVPKQNWLQGLAIALIAAALGWCGWRIWGGHAPRRLGPEYVYSLNGIRAQERPGASYREYARVATGLRQAHCLAVGPDDRFWVGGDTAVVGFNAAGTSVARLELTATPVCLTVAEDGRIYVGYTNRLIVRTPDGATVQAFPPLPPGARLTAIALLHGGVFVADAAHRSVWHYGSDGVLRGTIGKRDEARNIPGFIIPSPYFDLAPGTDGLLRVANPGRHRIEAYTVNGDLELFWGRASSEMDGFCGCCNPSYFALLPDGRFVTSEKGLRRIKLYEPDGRFLELVAGAEILGEGGEPFPVRTDARGRILALDVDRQWVRIFSRQ
jgi:hypothetical protein